MINKSLIKKGTLYVFKKRFIERANMNRLQKNRSSFLFQYNKLTISLSLSNILHIKTSLYLLLKKLKDFKGKSLVFAHDKSSLDSLEDFCYKLEVSGFYTSFTEKEKKQTKIGTRDKNIYIYTQKTNLRTPTRLHYFASS